MSPGISARMFRRWQSPHYRQQMLSVLDGARAVLTSQPWRHAREARRPLHRGRRLEYRT
jgi:hypothetical protein